MCSNVDEFKGKRVEKLTRDEGREKRAKGEHVSPRQFVVFMHRYPAFVFPLLAFQRQYFRRTFGERFWYNWHCKRDLAEAEDDVTPPGYYVDNRPHARMLTGRMFMLDVRCTLQPRARCTLHSDH